MKSLNIKRKVSNLLVALILATLMACSGNKVVVTTDDSADYQSARQLPPLKKDVNDAVVTSAYPGSIVGQSGAVTMSIEQVSDDVTRLNINAGIEDAWNSLLNDVRNSEVTLQGRNQAANQIEVGCGAIDDGAEESNEEGWSLFDNELIHEYCILQLNENRNQTRVQLLNRRGQEVPSSDAMTIFNKIINN